MPSLLLLSSPSSSSYSSSLLILWISTQVSYGMQNLSAHLSPSSTTTTTSAAAAATRDQRSSDEELLLRHLFKSYNPSARPVLNSSDTVQVSIQFSLMHIKDLDIRSQIFTTTGLLILEWTDERLTWRPSEYNDIEEIIIEVKILWKPEFAVINGAEKIYEEYNQFRAVISHHGLVHWEPGGVFATMCEIDITFYPFDRQRCELKFGAWSYHTNKMNLTVPMTTVNLDSYKKNGEWEVEGTTAKRHEFSYECCPDQRFSNTAFAVYLRRRHLFYVMNVIMPSIMTSILLLSIFFCTPAQKVQIGVVVLLSFRIFLLNVAGNIPKTSDHIPLLVIYLTCTLAITTMSMVLTVLVLNLYGVADRPVPVWMKKVFLVHLARLLGMNETARTYHDEVFAATVESMTAPVKPVNNRNLARFAQRQVPGSRSPAVIRSNDGDSMPGHQHQQQQRERRGNSTAADQLRIPSVSCSSSAAAAATTTDGGCPRSPSRADHSPTPPTSSAAAAAAAAGQDSQQPSAFTAAFQLQLLSHLTPTFRLPKTKDGNASVASALNYSREWTRLAEVFDRLFFWLFLAAIVLSTLGLFHPILFDKKPDFGNNN